MKIAAFTILLLGYSLLVSSQALRYTDTRDESFCMNVSNGTDFKSYESQSGFTFHVGDTLMIGRPATNSGSFTTLVHGKYTVGNALLVGTLFLSESLQSELVRITRIYVYHTKGSKKSPLYVLMFLENPDQIAMAKNRSVIDFEKSLLLGELVNLNRPLSREEAIAKLKESKDLLDLEIISQTKYDSIKAALTPIITNK